MDRGDVLFFNHRFIHGSSSNNSPFQRRSIVLQARKEIKRDEEKFEKESIFRKNFVIEFLNQKLNKLTGNNMYDSFNSKKYIFFNKWLNKINRLKIDRPSKTPLKGWIAQKSFKF